MDFNEALDNMLERMPGEDLRMLTAGMKIAREVGGSLADVLARLAETLRRKLEIEGKIKALTAMGKAQGYVMALLPWRWGSPSRRSNRRPWTNCSPPWPAGRCAR
ncbi:hypothetical protein HML84_15095 [Alcanivorax sp. IO_7]|nr:hypothetical protein HML84_15095 [Alcanivorax sp. IO_7]